MSKKSQLQFSIVTTEKVVYDKEVDSITLPTGAGEITVLPKHIPLISTIKTGAIRTKTNGVEQTFAVAGGVLEVRRNNHVVVLAGRTEPAQEIDIERAQAAYDRAKAYLEEKRNVSDADYARFQAMLEKNLNRINIARNHRKNR